MFSDSTLGTSSSEYLASTPADEVLRSLNKSGYYRQAIEFQVAQDAQFVPGEDPEMDVRREVQFAVALQHAGFFSLALEAYNSALNMAYRGQGLTRDFRKKILIQIATLNERIGRYGLAWNIINQIRRPDSTSIDSNIAMMGDPDWYFLTYMKLCFRLDEIALARHHLSHHQPSTQHSRDWARLFSLVLRVLDTKTVSDETKPSFDEIAQNYREYDAPGEPWLALFAAPLISKYDCDLSIEILEAAATHAGRLGKYFLVAAIYEELAKCYLIGSRRTAEARNTYCRALNAYGKCNLLLQNPLRSKLIQLGERFGMKPSELGPLALMSSSLLFDRSSIVFSEMCRLKAEINGEKPSRVFERFVEDWARVRFPGQVHLLAENEFAADFLLERFEGKKRIGTAIQAKHYQKPRNSIPRTAPLLRELAQKFDLDHIDQYVFVVSTSSPTGWRDSMWNSHATTKVRNIIVDTSVSVSVVTEPELQTDVVLNDHLLRMYFGHLMRNYPEMDSAENAKLTHLQI